MKNYLKNTDWQIVTGHEVDTLFGWQGAVTLPPLSCTGFLPNTNVVTIYCTSTSQLKNGDLVLITDTNYQPIQSLSVCAMRVFDLVPNQYFKVRTPRDMLSPAISQPVIARPVQPQDKGTRGDAADGWNKTPADWFWIDANPQNQDLGTKRVAAICKKTATSYHQHVLSNKDALELAGQPFTVKFRVKSAGSWRIFIIDNGIATYGAVQSGSGFVEAQHTISAVSGAGNLSVGVEHMGAVGSVYYYSRPFATNAVTVSAGYYTRQYGLFKPTVKFTPITLNGATVTIPSYSDGFGTFGYEFRLHEETHGAVADDVERADYAFEFNGVDANVTLAWRDGRGVPANYGAILTNGLAGSKVTGNGFCYFKNGEAFLYSDTPSKVFTKVSVDFSGFYL